MEMVALHKNIFYFYDLLSINPCHCIVSFHLVPTQHRFNSISPDGFGLANIIGSRSLSRNLELTLQINRSPGINDDVIMLYCILLNT